MAGKAESFERKDRFGNPTGIFAGYIVDPKGAESFDLSEHAKGRFLTHKVKPYMRKNRKTGEHESVIKLETFGLDGKKMVHQKMRVDKTRGVSSGVYFSNDYESPASGVHETSEVYGLISEEKVILTNSGVKVSMTGTLIGRNESAKKGGKPCKRKNKSKAVICRK